MLLILNACVVHVVRYLIKWRQLRIKENCPLLCTSCQFLFSSEKRCRLECHTLFWPSRGSYDRRLFGPQANTDIRRYLWLMHGADLEVESGGSRLCHDACAAAGNGDRYLY